MTRPLSLKMNATNEKSDKPLLNHFCPLKRLPRLTQANQPISLFHQVFHGIHNPTINTYAVFSYQQPMANRDLFASDTTDHWSKRPLVTNRPMYRPFRLQVILVGCLILGTSTTPTTVASANQLASDMNVNSGHQNHHYASDQPINHYYRYYSSAFHNNWSAQLSDHHHHHHQPQHQSKAKQPTDSDSTRFKQLFYPQPPVRKVSQSASKSAGQLSNHSTSFVCSSLSQSHAQ